MTGTFLAAWTKLRRPALLWGTYGAAAAVTALVTTLTFVFADDAGATAGAPRPGAGTDVTVASLSRASGLLQGLSSGVSIVGIIALCVAAATFAGEYSTGTLRNLLIRQPRRLRLLGGTWAAVATFMIGAVLVSAVVAGGVATLLAGGQGVDTGAWFTSDGLTSSLRTVGEVSAAAVGYATLGAALGVLMRASIPAVAVGFGWLFLVETIVAGTVDGSSRWLPGQVLSALAAGGTTQVAFGTALTTALGYVVVASVGAAASFVRRDVTA